MSRDRRKEKKERKPSLEEEYAQSKALERKATTLYKNIAKQKGKDELAEESEFEMYRDIGGERMFRRLKSGSVQKEYTEREMNAFIDRYEDQFNLSYEDNALADEESRSTSRIRNRKNIINTSQQTVPLSATDFVGTDGFVPESFTVIENGIPVTRTFLIR